MSAAAGQNTTPQPCVDVVVLDDDKLTLEIIDWTLRKTSASYRVFIDPEVAMQYLCGCVPRILIVDYYMPSTDGIEFLTQLKKKVNLGTCSVYLCSAIRPQAAQIGQLNALGAGVLEKSVVCDRTALLELIASQPALVST